MYFWRNMQRPNRRNVNGGYSPEVDNKEPVLPNKRVLDGPYHGHSPLPAQRPNKNKAFRSRLRGSRRLVGARSSSPAASIGLLLPNRPTRQQDFGGFRLSPGVLNRRARICCPSEEHITQRGMDSGNQGGREGDGCEPALQKQEWTRYVCLF